MRSIEMIGPDNRRCRVDPKSTAFWDWIYSYTEDAAKSCAIPGLRFRWAVGVFATDPHVGGISRAQFGRAVGRHPGHAGREIDGQGPQANAKGLLATHFRTEVIEDDGFETIAD